MKSGDSMKDRSIFIFAQSNSMLDETEASSVEPYLSQIISVLTIQASPSRILGSRLVIPLPLVGMPFLGLSQPTSCLEIRSI